MLDSGNNWELFGYDTRHLGKHWQSAWRDLLWADDSPVRQRLDEVVALRDTAQVRCYHAGRPVAAADTRCSAILLPEDQYLLKPLSFPVAVADDLQDVLNLEVTMHSPFAADDTAYGWVVTDRDDDSVHVQLVISSKAGVMAYLGKEFDLHDPRAQEVWVQSAGRMITLRGFGEGHREKLYRQRLRHTGVKLGAALVLLLMIVGAGTGLKKLELSRVQAMAAGVESRAGEASAMRSALVSANETVAAVNTVVARYPNVHGELARLTALMGDDVYLERFEISGPVLNLRGKATDAAAVMKRLNDEPVYASVEAPRAISRVRGTDLEQFHLKITLRDGEAL